MGIVDGVAEHVGERRITGLEGIDRGIGVVQRVGVGAVGVDDHLAIGAGNFHPDVAATHAGDRAGVTGFHSLDRDRLPGIGVPVLAAAIVIVVGAGTHIAGDRDRIANTYSFVDAVDVRRGHHLTVHADSDAARAGKLAAGTLVLAGTRRAAAAGVGVLVVDGVVDSDAAPRTGLGILVSDGLQDLIDTRRRGRPVEGNGQGAATVAQRTDDDGADAQGAAADVHAGAAAAGEAELVPRIGTAITLQGEYRAAPVAAGTEKIEFGVGQQRIGIKHDGRAALHEGRRGIQAAKAGSFVDVCRLEVEFLADRAGPVDAGSSCIWVGELRAAVLLVVDQYGEFDGAVKVGTRRGVGHPRGQGCVDVSPRTGQGDGIRAVIRNDDRTRCCDGDGAVATAPLLSCQGNGEFVIRAVLLSRLSGI